MREPRDKTDATLHKLLSRGAVQSVALVAEGDQWTARAKVGTRWRRLRNADGRVGYWASLDQVACWVRDQGITEWSVDARHYWPPERAATPNATTINAIAELNAGNGKRFDTAGALFRYLGL